MPAKEDEAQQMSSNAEELEEEVMEQGSAGSGDEQL